MYKELGVYGCKSMVFGVSFLKSLKKILGNNQRLNAIFKINNLDFDQLIYMTYLYSITNNGSYTDHTVRT